MQKKKEGTGRIVLRNEFGLVNTFTLETSFAGSDSSRTHFQIQDLVKMGLDVGVTIFLYFNKSCIIKGEQGNLFVPQQEYENFTQSISCGESTFVPDSSESDDTTSDEELLRVCSKKTKKVRKTTFLGPPSMLSRAPSNASMRSSVSTAMSSAPSSLATSRISTSTSTTRLRLYAPRKKVNSTISETPKENHTFQDKTLKVYIH
jgi:hypothetical protein